MRCLTIYIGTLRAIETHTKNKALVLHWIERIMGKRGTFENILKHLKGILKKKIGTFT
jgi:hypothetical protein